MDSTILELCVVFDGKLRLSNQQYSCVAPEVRVYKRESVWRSATVSCVE